MCQFNLVEFNLITKIKNKKSDQPTYNADYVKVTLAYLKNVLSEF